MAIVEATRAGHRRRGHAPRRERRRRAGRHRRAVGRRGVRHRRRRPSTPGELAVPVRHRGSCRRGRHRLLRRRARTDTAGGGHRCGRGGPAQSLPPAVARASPTPSTPSRQPGPRCRGGPWGGQDEDGDVEAIRALMSGQAQLRLDQDQDAQPAAPSRLLRSRPARQRFSALSALRLAEEAAALRPRSGGEGCCSPPRRHAQPLGGGWPCWTRRRPASTSCWRCW